MLFNSQTFVVFFVCVFAGYWLLRERRLQNCLLLVASYIFYGTWSWKFLLLMMASTAFDYLCGLALGATQDKRLRKYVLIGSVSANLGLLFAFKYFGFFVAEAGQLLGGLGFNVSTPVLDIVLPVGISFYTFQSLGYVVDVYRGKLPAVRNLLTYALYVAFFPQLVAGPIERATHLVPQFERVRVWSSAGLQSGIFLMVWGLFKKIVIADNLAPFVDAVFDNPDAYSGVAITSAIVFFAFQIYCDFSGYTDTARGAARTLGFELMRNFDNPYTAVNPVDFWRRWHISLSQWFQDYLYYPLAMRYMRKGGWASKYKAHIVAMTLIGVWHGANWTFAVFGLYWGVLIALYLYWTQRSAQASPQSLARRVREASVSRAASIAAMFALVCIGWVFFRAPSLSNAWQVLAGTISLSGAATVVQSNVASAPILWLLIFGLLIAEWLNRNRRQLIAEMLENQLSNIVLRNGLVVLILYWYVAGLQGPAKPFIYFQF